MFAEPKPESNFETDAEPKSENQALVPKHINSKNGTYELCSNSPSCRISIYISLAIFCSKAEQLSIGWQESLFR